MLVCLCEVSPVPVGVLLDRFQKTVAGGRWCGIRRAARFTVLWTAAALVLLATSILPLSTMVHAQSTSATVNGQVTDPNGKVVPETRVEAVNIDTNIVYPTRTNTSGIYAIPGLPPGRYRLVVRRDGFKEINKTDITLNVQDILEQNFSLQVGSTSESVTVTGAGVNINTTDGSVSTVIDRQFVENMPLNGRSFQDLLTLAPGVALAASVNANAPSGGVGEAGEITVNGQRTEANYFTVDGVSVNTGGSDVRGAGVSGGTPGETILGTTQSLVSIDALQEFRATTSTYSAEYGRTPGGQFAFTTRSGTNSWNGSAYDYFRNDVMDANNWFNNHASPPVSRLPERQNDFGGTLGGPILIPKLYNGKDKTFFFCLVSKIRG